MKGHKKYNWMGKGLHKVKKAVKEEKWYYSKETEELVSVYYGLGTAAGMEKYIEVKAKYSKEEFAPKTLQEI